MVRPRPGRVDHPTRVEPFDPVLRLHGHLEALARGALLDGGHPGAGPQLCPSGPCPVGVPVDQARGVTAHGGGVQTGGVEPAVAQLGSELGQLVQGDPPHGLGGVGGHLLLGAGHQERAGPDHGVLQRGLGAAQLLEGETGQLAHRLRPVGRDQLLVQLPGAVEEPRHLTTGDGAVHPEGAVLVPRRNALAAQILHVRVEGSGVAVVGEGGRAQGSCGRLHPQAVQPQHRDPEHPRCRCGRRPLLRVLHRDGRSPVRAHRCPSGRHRQGGPEVDRGHAVDSLLPQVGPAWVIDADVDLQGHPFTALRELGLGHADVVDVSLERSDGRVGGRGRHAGQTEQRTPIIRPPARRRSAGRWGSR